MHVQTATSNFNFQAREVESDLARVIGHKYTDFLVGHSESHSLKTSPEYTQAWVYGECM